MLRYDQYIPADVREGAPLFVLLHGRGSHKGDLMGLQPFLPAEAMVVAPEAPFPGAPWGYGPGWAWYRFMGRNRPDAESFVASQEQLHAFLQQLPGLLPVKLGPVILGGFSQGGVMSLGYALRNPGTIRHVINFSGFFPDHPSVKATPETVQGTRFFWGHGMDDQAISFKLAVEGRSQLLQAGADLTARDYAMGHSIDRTELQDVLKWLRQA